MCHAGDAAQGHTHTHIVARDIQEQQEMGGGEEKRGTVKSIIPPPVQTGKGDLTPSVAQGSRSRSAVLYGTVTFVSVIKDCLPLSVWQM